MAARRLALAAASALVLVCALAWRRGRPTPDRGFVRREGARFVLRGREFRFVGANVDVMHGPRERLNATRVLDTLTADRLGVVRLWALGETDGAEAWRDDFAFRRGPRGWVLASFAHLDRVLVALRSRGLRAIVVLANRWSDYGGFPQYLRWAGVTPRGGHLRASELRRVYTDPAVERAWREHARRVVGRTNAITGVPYRDDPTVMAWELMNEGSALTCEAGDRLVAWVDRQARFVHALAPQQLVGAGAFTYESPQGRAIWRRMHALDSVDYADHHAYFDGDAEVMEPSDLAPWMAERAAVAREIGKPFVLGEVGFVRSAFSPEARGRWFAAFLDAADRVGASGVAAWVYQPWTEQDNVHGIFGWGPRARENEPTRAALREAALRWSRPSTPPRQPPVRRIPRLRDQAPINTQDAWRETADGAEMELDPWSFEEGCAEGARAWIELPLCLPAFPATTLDLTLASPALGPLGIEVALDEVWLGRVDAPGVPLRVPVLRSGDREVRWLRLSSSTPRGRALLASYGVALPGRDRLVLRAR